MTHNPSHNLTHNLQATSPPRSHEGSQRFREPSSLEALDHSYLWHPFTAMSDWMKRDPLIISSGDGPCVKDIHGREYYDGNSSLWVNVHGHRRREIDDAIRAQLDCIAHSTMLGLSNPPAIQLAERLSKIAPSGLNRVFFSDSGSEAVEIALKMAFQYWRLKGETGRDCYVTLEQAYHGDTIGCVSVGGIDTFHAVFGPLLFRTHRITPGPLPDHGAAQPILASPDSVEETIARNAPTIAAVIVEPLVQAAAGMLLQPPGFLKTIERACRDTGVILIVDEVATGFGRTGKMFACDHEGISPDIMTVAKGLTGGYLPLAATLVNDRVFEPFRDGRPGGEFYHGHSYTGNALACAAALANLDIFERERTLDRLAPIIELLRCRLAEFARLPHVLEVRQLGVMVGIELAQNRNGPVPYPAGMKMGAAVCYRARELGLITRPLGDVVVFMPPLCCTESDINTMLDILYQAVIEVTQESEL